MKEKIYSNAIISDKHNLFIKQQAYKCCLCSLLWYFQICLLDINYCNKIYPGYYGFNKHTEKVFYK